MRRPRILVTLDTGEDLRRGVPFPIVTTKAAYARAIEAAGGLPLMIAPSSHPGILDELALSMDGLVITGGAFDIDPARYGRSRENVRLDAIKPERTGFEEGILRRALEDRRPVLAVCGGMQLLNVVLGGTLLQDIRSARPPAIDHEQPSSPALPHHEVELAGDSWLARTVAATSIPVNSTHHQAVDDLGQGVRVLGRSPDGIVELISVEAHAFVVGVQWHPELLDDHVSRALYGELVARAGNTATDAKTEKKIETKVLP